MATLGALEAHYTALHEIFMSLASTTKGKAQVMSAVDFSKFVMDAKCLQPEKNWKITDLYHDRFLEDRSSPAPPLRARGTHARVTCPTEPPGRGRGPSDPFVANTHPI